MIVATWDIRDPLYFTYSIMIQIQATYFVSTFDVRVNSLHDSCIKLLQVLNLTARHLKFDNKLSTIFLLLSSF